MSENLGRAFAGAAALAGLWIAVYWWWEPSPSSARAVSAAPTTGSTPAPGARPPISPPLPSSPSTPTPTAQAPVQQVARTPPPAVIAPRFRDYTVRQGDTLASIASRELGDAKWADAISRANPLANLERLRPGRVIRIPLDPTNVQGKPSPNAPPPAPSTPSSAPPVATPVAPPVATTYSVRRGDTLSGIAKAHYGSATFASLIAKANGMDDEDSLREGQKLVIPPKPR
ncbi:MAG: LysM peptidoglycan-binding domain-containing protein [Phycisphaerae bacterium]|nr:LysM peptidoglycan-binding domain-containing protein [Phycisphaerae bacterium]